LQTDPRYEFAINLLTLKARVSLAEQLVSLQVTTFRSRVDQANESLPPNPHPQSHYTLRNRVSTGCITLDHLTLQRWRVLLMPTAAWLMRSVLVPCSAYSPTLKMEAVSSYRWPILQRTTTTLCPTLSVPDPPAATSLQLCTPQSCWCIIQVVHSP
jgi:hypothetical protein